MRTVSIEEAAAHLPELIAEACRGGEVVIAQADTPAVRLMPMPPPTGNRDHAALLGFLKDRIVLKEGWDEPLEDLRPYME
jgi:antitoxin (DNA-binding transcriptional repressor) of toxin-antitoxin stability system